MSSDKREGRGPKTAPMAKDRCRREPAPCGIGPDIVGSGTDRSSDPAVLGARKGHVWYGPVTLNLGSEPYMTMAIAGNRSAAGVAVAQVNLKLIWDVISAISVGTHGHGADGRR